MRFYFIELLLSIVFIVIQLSQISAEPIASVSPISKNESEKEAIDYAGAYVVGTMFLETTLAMKRPGLRARVPKNWRGSLSCVRGQSRDGIYNSKYEYRIPADWSGNGVLEFKYPTAFLKRLHDASPKDFAMVLQPGGCKTETKQYLAGYWNTIDVRKETSVALLINSVGAEEAFLFVGTNPQAPEVNCQRIDADQLKGYDFQCNIPKDQITSASIRIEIVAMRRGVRDRPIPIELLVR